jgi:hypothetical protein
MKTGYSKAHIKILEVQYALDRSITLLVLNEDTNLVKKITYLYLVLINCFTRK